jgi:hypothetical protein
MNYFDWDSCPLTVNCHLNIALACDSTPRPVNVNDSEAIAFKVCKFKPFR